MELDSSFDAKPPCHACDGEAAVCSRHERPMAECECPVLVCAVPCSKCWGTGEEPCPVR